MRQDLWRRGTQSAGWNLSRSKEPISICLNSIDNKKKSVCAMGKFECCAANILYTLKRQHPAIREFGKRMKEVERELNKENSNNSCDCECKRKPTCKNVCKNRQKP